MKNEADVNKRLKKVLREMTPKFDYTRIENSVQLGTFDSSLTGMGATIWLELKFAGPEAMPEIRPGQAGFGYRIKRAGGRALYLVGHPDGSYRILDGECRGPDWRNWVVYRGEQIDSECVCRLLLGKEDVQP